MKITRYTIALISILFVISFLGCNLIKEESSSKKKKFIFNTVIEEIKHEGNTIKIKKSKRNFMTQWVPNELKVLDKSLLDDVRSGDFVYLTIEGTKENPVVSKIEKINPE